MAEQKEPGRMEEVPNFIRARRAAGVGFGTSDVNSLLALKGFLPIRAAQLDGQVNQVNFPRRKDWEVADA